MYDNKTYYERKKLPICTKCIYNPSNKSGSWRPDPGTRPPTMHNGNYYDVHEYFMMKKIERKEKAKKARAKKVMQIHREREKLERIFRPSLGRDCFFSPSVILRNKVETKKTNNQKRPSAPPFPINNQKRPSAPNTQKRPSAPPLSDIVDNKAKTATDIPDSQLFSFGFSVGDVKFNTYCEACTIL